MFGGKNIEKSYGKNKVLHNVTFAHENNKIIGIFGLNGSGKTTLINLLMRFYEVDSGKSSVDGEDISKIKKYYLRRIKLLLTN